MIDHVPVGVLNRVLAAAVLLAAPALAEAAVIPGQGIAGVRIGMTAEQVRQVLGQPPGRPEGYENGAGRELRYPGLRIVLLRGRVAVVATTRPDERTMEGVGIGSTVEEVRDLGGVRCLRRPGTLVCRRGGVAPGRRVTDFVLAGPAVAMVVVMRVPR